MTNFDSVDYFTDQSIVPNPHPYFDHLRARTRGLPDQQRRRGHRLGGGERGLQRHRLRTRPASPSAARSPRFRSCPRAMTSARARGAPQRDPDVRAHGHDGSTEPHPMRDRSFPAAHAEAAEGERGLHVAAGRPSASTGSSPNGSASSLAAYARPFSLIVVADLLGVPEEDHKEFRGASGRCCRNPDRRARPRADRHQPVGVGRREVQLLHRGPPAEPPRRRADLTRDGEVPGRVDPRSGRRGPDSHVPIRRRTGNHRQTAQRRAAGARRPARHPATAAR